METSNILLHWGMNYYINLSIFQFRYLDKGLFYYLGPQGIPEFIKTIWYYLSI